MPMTDEQSKIYEAITAERFRKATGYEPQDDDLDRCNCPRAGSLKHQSCGWDYAENLPRFMLPPRNFARG